MQDVDPKLGGALTIPKRSLSGSDEALTPGGAQPCLAPVPDTEIEQLIMEHAGGLRRHALRLTRNSVEADDLVQETIERTWRFRARFRPGSSFAAWAHVILQRAFSNDRRRDRWSAELAPEVLETKLTADPAQEHAFALKELSQLFALLSADQRASLALIGQGVPYADAAAELNVDINTLKSRVARGRATLKELFEGKMAGPAVGRSKKQARKRKPLRSSKNVVIG